MKTAKDIYEFDEPAPNPDPHKFFSWIRIVP